MNNNKLDEAALLAGGKGVFAKASYTTIGTKDKPEDYNKKIPQRSNFYQKQFTTIPPKEGNTNEVYFEKRHTWISQGDKYVDRVKYAETQTEKKKGFLTSDFSKKDEFSYNFRTNQWREQLATEGKFSKKALDMLTATEGGIIEEAPEDPANESLLYDLVFQKDDPGFSGASKTHRDTMNKTRLAPERVVGTQMTTNLLAFQGPEKFEKPEHARRAIVKETFYRKTNILFPEGCAATTGN